MAARRHKLKLCQHLRQKDESKQHPLECFFDLCHIRGNFQKAIYAVMGKYADPKNIDVELVPNPLFVTTVISYRSLEPYESKVETSEDVTLRFCRTGMLRKVHCEIKIIPMIDVDLDPNHNHKPNCWALQATFQFSST